MRQSGVRLPLLLLMASGFYGNLARERLRQFIAQDITLTVAAVGDLARISSVAEEVGTAMYGYQPSDEMHRVLPLRPALRLVSRLAQVKEVPAGTQIGYGLTYTFDRPARLGLVPIGYSDGYRRGLSNQAVMRVVGQYAPVRGRVSMDQTIIDLTDVPAAKVGDEVEVISPETDAPNSADNLARLVDGIVPEIVSGLNRRIRRVPTT